MSKIEIKYVSTDSLRPYAGNARIHSKKQIRQIADSMQRFANARVVKLWNSSMYTKKSRPAR